MDVAGSFKVAQDDASWPVQLRGMELGRAVSAARELEALARDDERRSRASRKRTFGERRHPSLPRLSKTRWGRRLTSAGFDWGDVGERRYRLLAAALRAYHSECGDLILPRNFRVPSRPPYPRELAGSNLDRAVYCLKFYKEHVAGNIARQAELRDLGFVWPRLQPEFNLVVEALLAYHRLFGHMAVPVDYRVPLDDEHFPDECKGMPLGRRCAQIRNRLDFASDAAKYQQLESIGFVWSLGARKRDTLAKATEVYRRVAGGNIPVRFVVPYDSDDWPPELQGFELGRKAYDATRREQHIPSNSVSSPALAYRFTQILDALRTYVAINGDANVPQKFVVPHSPPWPDNVRGMRLGHRVAQIRSKGYYLKDPMRRQERTDQLTALGFVWNRRL